MTSLMEEFVKSPSGNSAGGKSQGASTSSSVSSKKNADRLKTSKSKKRVAFASESSLEDQHSFERVTLRVSRLAELWHPNPHNRDVWLLPDEEVSDESVIILTWAYGHNGWVDFKKNIPEDVQVGNPLARIQSKHRVPESLAQKVSLQTWQALFTELEDLLERNLAEQPDFDDEGGGCCCFFNTTEKAKRVMLSGQRDKFDADIEAILLKYNAIFLGIDITGLHKSQSSPIGKSEMPKDYATKAQSHSPRGDTIPNSVSFGENDKPINLKHMVAHYNRVGYIALFYYWIEIDVTKLPANMNMV